MKKLLIIVVIMGISIGLFAQSGFYKDIPLNHWAFESVRKLYERNVFSNFPATSKFNGEGDVKRYELAVLIKNILDESDKRTRLTQNDLDIINELLKEFANELMGLGVNLSERIKKLESKVTALEYTTGEMKKNFDSRISIIEANQDRILDKLRLNPIKPVLMDEDSETTSLNSNDVVVSKKKKKGSSLLGQIVLIGVLGAVVAGN